MSACPRGPSESWRTTVDVADVFFQLSRSPQRGSLIPDKNQSIAVAAIARDFTLASRNAHKFERVSELVLYHPSEASFMKATTAS